LPQELESFQEQLVLHSLVNDLHGSHLVNVEKVTGFHRCARVALGVQLADLVFSKVANHLFRWPLLSILSFLTLSYFNLNRGLRFVDTRLAGRRLLHCLLSDAEN